MTYFYGLGSTASRLGPLQGGSLRLFLRQCPKIDPGPFKQQKEKINRKSDCKSGHSDLLTIIQITSNLTSGRQQSKTLQLLQIDKSYNTISSRSLKNFAT